MKNIRICYLEIFPFLVVKFSIYLNRHVFVMLFFGNDIVQIMNFCTLYALTVVRQYKQQCHLLSTVKCVIFIIY